MLAVLWLTFLVITVIFGTVASAKAYSNLAPCLMIPLYSWCVPANRMKSFFGGLHF